MKIKYRLIYEWTDEQPDILDYANTNDCSIKESMQDLIEWNKAEIVNKMDNKAGNILNNYINRFEYEIINDSRSIN